MSINTFFNGGASLDTWYFSGESDPRGTQLIKAYMDGVLVFRKILYVTLACNPPRADYTLRTIIDKAAKQALIDIAPPEGPDFTQTFAETIVTLNGGCHFPSLHTGDLSGMNVTLINNGSIEAGYDDSEAALHLTSQITIVNNGSILGRGKHGSDGANGANGPSYTVDINKCETRYDGSNYWYVTCGPCPASSNTTVTYKWDGGGGTVATCATCPGPSSKSAGGGVTYSKGARKTGDGLCDGDTYDKYAVKRCYVAHSQCTGGAGGAGGKGGAGQYYQHPAVPGEPGKSGKDGTCPPGTKGGSGGNGGTGGVWGTGGAAIVGKNATNSSLTGGGTIKGSVN